MLGARWFVGFRLAVVGVSRPNHFYGQPLRVHKSSFVFWKNPLNSTANVKNFPSLTKHKIEKR